MDTKALCNEVAARIGRDADSIANCVKALGEILVESIKEGDSVAMPGFGSFEPKMKMERVATHPASGKKLLVPPKLTLVFKPSAILKQKVRK